MDEERPLNHLEKEVSPYLRQHARNPVNWYPWGPEALGLAAQRDKPILLSIGYSACHWCHVMEQESFENPATAALMNDQFVNIKVDREERPDLDQIYQLVVQLMGRSGGWPLTVFLTPAQYPFFAGTYFPPVDRYGMPGFPALLHAVADAYRTRRDDVESHAEELRAAIIETTSRAAIDMASTIQPEQLRLAGEKLSARFDERHGGFGTRPKFPSTMALEALLRRGALDGDEGALRKVRRALDAMRGGGIYNHLGGGFHRYSTDERWLVPHFEKMLYDNANLLRLYGDGFRVCRDPRYADTARALATYVAREMTDSGGGFFATQDADSEGVEGKFFVFTPAEIRAYLFGDEEAIQVALCHFGVSEAGNFEETGATVLSEACPLEEVALTLNLTLTIVEKALARAKYGLFREREKRVKPFRDEKILASWNGLMVGSLAVVGAALGEEKFIAAASRSFAFVDETLIVRSGGAVRVMRHIHREVVKGPGFLDDYAFLADAAVDLYEATGSAGYIGVACALADALIECFWDNDDGGFFYTPHDGERLIHRAKYWFDQAIPSGASIASRALGRLGALVDSKYQAYSDQQLEQLAFTAVENPFGLSQSLCELDTLVRGRVEIVLVGSRNDHALQSLARVALEAYLPHRVIAWMDPNDPASVAACLRLADGKRGHTTPVAYVCREGVCSLPTSSPEALRRALAS